MSTRSIDYRDAVDHLPQGASLVLQEVAWEEYEQVLDDLVDRPGLRITYDQGRLEIMSPLPEHEPYKEFIAQIAYTLRDELDVNVEPCGSATWKKKREGKGTEPDACFYVTNADRIIGKRKIDLSVDPPPDIAVEIDTTNESVSKFPIYAVLGVPEIWRYDCQRARRLSLLDKANTKVGAALMSDKSAESAAFLFQSTSIEEIPARLYCLCYGIHKARNF